MNPADEIVVVLFADVAGSSRLYGQLGDAQALATISRCLETARDAAASFDGRLVKTIGDEAMFVFRTADQAAAAAAEIQGRISAREGRGEPRLALRIGFHAGHAIERDGDVFGDSVNVAARMVALAKGGQIILSASTARALSPYLHTHLREIDMVTLKGKDRDIDVMELSWQSRADLTELVARPSVRSTELELRHGDKSIRLTADASSITLGRDAESDLVVPDKLASRSHARIERRRDKYVLIDQSTNGTYVTIGGQREIVLHREELLLRGSGRISLGHPHDDGSAGTVAYTCRESG